MNTALLKQVKALGELIADGEEAPADMRECHAPYYAQISVESMLNTARDKRARILSAISIET